MLFYAGGNELNPTAPGYSFWQNSISDLGRTIAWSGKNNIIAQVLFSISMGLWGFSFVPSIYALSTLLSESKQRSLFSKVSTFFAFLCVMFLICEIAFFPIDIYPEIHNILAFISYLSLFIVEITYSIIIFLDKNYPDKYAICFLAVAVVIIIYFIITNAVSQKLVSITLTLTTLIIFPGAWKMANRKK
jgi:hypothetical membrane protein